MKDLPGVRADRLEAHLRKLTVDIGVRLAGSAGEREAARYIEEQFAAAGAETSVETFPVKERAVTRESLEVRVGDVWRTFPCSLFGSTPGTGGETIEAPLCFFEAAAEYRRADLSHLAGKGVVHLGCHIESRENYRRLIEAKPAFLLFVDVRYPGTTPLADGMFPSYVRALGAVPVVNVAFMDAWDWKLAGAAAARLKVEGGMRDSTSQNVVAELAGTDPEAGLLVLGGHHDTQANSVGADDNACGVAAVLELARVLAPLERKRSVRLISFGTEEQLSVGSAEYVRRHREEIRTRGRFVLNFDGVGSHMGWTELFYNGPPELADYLTTAFERHDLYVRPNTETVPYADHFPFAAAGVPGVFLHRCNCTSGRFFHHRPDDDMSRVSAPLMARLLDVAAEVIAECANAPEMPFPTVIPDDQAESVRKFWEDLFGGWEGGEGRMTNSQGDA